MSASMSHLPLQPDETAANLGTIVTTTLDVSHTDDPRGTWFNQYFVNGGNSRIARGRHCTDVHRAEDQNERKVVIKVLQRKLNEDKWRHLRKSQQVSNGGLLPSEYRAQREVGILKATTRFRHPNIVPLFEVIDDPRRSKLYLVMEDVLGGAVPFEEQADDSKPVFSVAQTRRVFRDVVLGLEFLHHYGIVHRDIKPANLLIGEDGIVKICDFSVSHVLTSQRVQRTSAMDVLNDPILFSEAPESLGSHEGTPSFIAPECVWQADFKVNPDLVSPSSTPPRPSQSSRIALSVTEDSDSESSESRDYPSCSLPFIDTLPAMQPIVTKALDIWSLGVTIYCCLFGHLPFTFTGAGSNFTMYKIICTRDWVPDVTMGRDRVPTGGRHPTDRQFEGGFAIQLLDGMLQKDPTKRLTLQEIKHHPWMLEDLPDAKLWLTITSLYTPALGEKPPRKRLSTQPHAASSGDLASPKQPEKKNWVERVGKGVTKGVGKGFRALIPGRDRSNSESRTSRKP